MAADVLSVSDAARELSQELREEVRPRDISRLFYERDLRDDLCPIVSGRRVIRRDYLSMVVMAMRRRGWIRQQPQEAAQ